MSDGCTSCGRKGGCDHRKAGMFAAIEAALARLYPGRRWHQGPFPGQAEFGVSPALAARLCDRLAERLSALCVHLPGGPLDRCSYLYVLCTGRPPALIQLREGLLAPEEGGLPSGRGALEETYLRVALSTVAPFAAVQQVRLRGELLGDGLWVEEAPRTGVFDPPLLPRFRKLVAVLAELQIQHLDCGDIMEPPPGFDPGSYPDRYGEPPALLNYLFFPEPAASLSSTLIRLSAGASPSHLSPPIPDRPRALIE
jgi:hypothetical protein